MSKDSDDMSIIDDEEDESQPVTLPPFDFSFNKSAWDDRELVHAYDAAMSEFHTHHPGPGSWLDKATAALAKGRPLPGSNAYDTEWFTASLPEPESIQPQPELTGQPPPKKSRKARRPDLPTCDEPLNPYTAPQQTAGPSNPSPGASPSYNPPSPAPAIPQHSQYQPVPQSQPLPQAHPPAWSRPQSAIQPLLHPTTHVEETRPVAGGSGSHPGPSIGSQPTGDVSHSEALSYAMTSQYWAGYWMGVAQVRFETPRAVEERPVVQEPISGENKYPEGGEDDLEGMGVEPSNVFITRQHFSRTNGLKR